MDQIESGTGKERAENDVEVLYNEAYLARKKPVVDEKDYRYIRLKNGLEVLLISSPTSLNSPKPSFDSQSQSDGGSDDKSGDSDEDRESESDTQSKSESESMFH